MKRCVSSETSMKLFVGFLTRRVSSLLTMGFTCAALAFGMVPVMAHASTIPPAVIAIQAQDVLLAPLVGGPVFASSTSLGRPLGFVATISRADSSPVDVYLGVVIPGGRWLS